MSRTGCIYLHTCTVTNKVYVGQTVQTMNKRWKSHTLRANRGENYNSHFYNALRKYGTDCWKHKVLVDNVACEYLNKLEVFFIKYYDSYSNGYNSTIGGEGTLGYRMTEEHKEALRNAHKGNSYGKGWKPSAEQKEKQRKSLTGQKRSKETKKLISESKLGRKHYRTRPINIHCAETGKLLYHNVIATEWCRENTGYSIYSVRKAMVGIQHSYKGLVFVYTISYEDTQ